MPEALPTAPPLKIYRYFLRGMEQHMWFLGQDARHGGNLLLRHGFTRCRSSPQGSSRYRLTWQDATVELHSFCAGLYRADAPDFIYIRGKYNAFRYDGTEPPNPDSFCHAPIAIPAHTQQSDPFFAAVALYLDWAEEYEAWIEKLAGPGYRAGLHPHCPLPWLPPAEARRWLRTFRDQPLTAPVPRRRTRALGPA